MNSPQTFRNFVLREKRPWIWVAVMAIPLQFWVFKLLYPFPNFTGDSWSYIAAAMLRTEATIWPAGYSRFLGLVHFFSRSDTVLVAVQYLLLEASSLFFLFTAAYFMRPGKTVFIVLFIFGTFSPLYLHIGNYVSSDALFTALSFCWFAQLLWLLYRPSVWQLIPLALVLLALFTIRYNALYYPVISFGVLLVSSLRWRVRIAGILLCGLLIGAYVWHVENSFGKVNGVRQFSPFSGWQLANNALYMYEHVDVGKTEPVPLRFQLLDSLARHSIAVHREDKYQQDYYYRGIYYIWNHDSPLAQYLNHKWREDSTRDMFYKWLSVAPEFGEYGRYLIRQYPGAYLTYFAWPNMLQYIQAPLENLALYNQGTDEIDRRAAYWFGYKSLQIRQFSRDYRVTVLNLYPSLLLLVNIGFILSLILWLLFKGYRGAGRPFNLAIALAALFWIVNFGFSVLSAPVVFRYQIFPMVLCFTLLSILAGILVQSSNPSSASNAGVTAP